jgi:shikimate kinase
MKRHVYLVGMPGSGKSAVGRELARRLGMPFVDLDREIETRAGASIESIFHDEGEDRFRNLEEQALREVAAGEPAVVACGGGSVIRDENRHILRTTGTVVSLTVPLAQLKRRVLRGRPLIKDPIDLDRLYLEREILYREVADHQVNANGDPAAVARGIAEVLP